MYITLSLKQLGFSPSMSEGFSGKSYWQRTFGSGRV
jgi:hypothetical protein